MPPGMLRHGFCESGSATASPMSRNFDVENMLPAVLLGLVAESPGFQEIDRVLIRLASGLEQQA